MAIDNLAVKSRIKIRIKIDPYHLLQTISIDQTNVQFPLGYPVANVVADPAPRPGSQQVREGMSATWSRAIWCNGKWNTPKVRVE